MLSGGADRLIKLWDITSGEEVEHFEGHQGDITAVGFASHSRIASASRDYVIRIWDRTSRQLVRTLGGNDITPPGFLSIVANGDLAVSSTLVRINVWNLTTGKLIQTHEPEGLPSSCKWSSVPGREVRFLGTSSRSISTRGNRHRSRGPGIWQKNEFGSVSCDVAISPDARRGLSSHSESDISVWELGTGRRVHTFKGHKAGVTSLAFSCDGRFAVSGAADGSISLWDISISGVSRPENKSPENSPRQEQDAASNRRPRIIE